MTTLRIRDDVAWTGEGARIVALNLTELTATPFALEGSAAVVWQTIFEAGGITLEQLLADLYAAFDADEDRIRDDVERLVDDLIARGLLESVR